MVEWCKVESMKIKVELPRPIVQRLRSRVPIGKRSKFVADLISRKSRMKTYTLERAALKANTLGKVNRDMEAWQALPNCSR